MDLNRAGLYASESVPSLVTIADRMRHVLEINGWSADQWTKMTNAKERTQVSKILKALEAAPMKPTTATWIFIELALAAQVSLDWLLLGRGSMRGDQPQGDQYPSRATALTSAYLTGGTPAEILATIAAEAGHKADPGFDYWMTRLRTLNAEHHARPVSGGRKKSTRPAKD